MVLRDKKLEKITNEGCDKEEGGLVHVKWNELLIVLSALSTVPIVKFNSCDAAKVYEAYRNVKNDLIAQI